jgi:hypothetical protein
VAGVKVPVVTLNVTVPFPVPVLELKVNQAALSLALQFNVPPPVLLMLRVCVAGFAPPWVAAKARLVGLMPMAGGTGAAATVKETGTLTGVTPVPPLSMTVPL